MGTTQLILIAGGLVLIGILSMTVFKSFNKKTDNDLSNQAYFTACGIGQSLIEKISTKAFDQKSVGKTFSNPDSLTAPAFLGPDAGEYNVALYNDVDDFNNYTQADTMKDLGIFNIKVYVNYVKKFDPNVISSYQTFSKRIDVFVTNKYLTDTLKLNDVVSY